MDETKFFVIVKNEDNWKIKFGREKGIPTEEVFSSYESASEWIKSHYSRSWIDCRIDGYEGYLLSFDDWAKGVKDGCFIDYDGWGDVLDSSYETIFKDYYPSDYEDKKPENAEYVLWYNR